MRRAKVDANQQEIVKALRQVGASVQSLARIGKGCPDLLVSFRGQNYVLEIKGQQGLVRAFQAAWMSNWQGPVAVVRSVDDALKAIGLEGVVTP